MEFRKHPAPNGNTPLMWVAELNKKSAFEIIFSSYLRFSCSAFLIQNDDNENILHVLSRNHDQGLIVEKDLKSNFTLYKNIY